MTYIRPMPCAVDTDPYYRSPQQEAEAQEAVDALLFDLRAELDATVASALADRVLTAAEVADVLQAKIVTLKGVRP